jgi:type II secretory pathway pseudopilin PulG
MNVRVINRQSDKKAAFTIVELLTVMSIIVILITLLVPSLNMAKRYAKNVRQRAQFHSVGMALDAFSADWDGYPESNQKDEAAVAYCGAMKLAEAMMGQDLLGFHPSSRFRSDGLDGTGAMTPLYPPVAATPDYAENIKSRKGPYLPLENANAYKLKYLYGKGKAVPLNEERFVLCDIYGRVTLQPDSTETQKVSGKTGMPVLYYKANVQGTQLPVSKGGITNGTIPTKDPDPLYIYNHFNNNDLVRLGMPWDTSVPKAAHPMASDDTGASGGTDLRGNTATAFNFYNRIWNEKVYNSTTNIFRPYRSDSYILMSAGFDGEYGTPDDIFNFGE